MKADPQFIHDCLKCSYLGRDIDDDGEEIDVYICASNGSNGSIIGRYGNYGHEYISLPGWVKLVDDMSPWIFTAHQRAIQKGKRILRK